METNKKEMTDNFVNIEIIEGVSGLSLYINDYRVAGGKPYGGGRSLKSWKVEKDTIINLLK